MGLWDQTLLLILIAACITETNSAIKSLLAQNKWSSFSSPNFPNEYPNKVDEINELIATVTDSVICIKADTFDLQYSGNCTKDFVAVQSSLLIHPKDYWCGSDMPSTCGEKELLYVRFRSDNNVTRSGFQISYRQELRDEDPPIGMIVGLTVVPVVIMGFMLCYYIRRKKPRLFTDTVRMEGLDNRGSSTQTPGNQSSGHVASISHTPASDVNHLGPPSYENAVGSKLAEQPPSYDSLPVLENNHK